MALILERHFGIPEEDQCIEAARLLAYDRNGQRIRARMRQAIKYLASEGVTTKIDDQLVLRDPARSLVELEDAARRRVGLEAAARSPSSPEAQPKPAVRPEATGEESSSASPQLRG
jgi:hypothetical protein